MEVILVTLNYFANSSEEGTTGGCQSLSCGTDLGPGAYSFLRRISRSCWPGIHVSGKCK